MIGRLILLIALSFGTLLLAKSNQTLRIEAKQVRDNIVVEATNPYPFSVSLYYNASYKNLDSNHKLPATFVLKPHSTRRILELKIKGKVTYKHSYRWIVGSVDAKHNDNYLYSLPYKIGSKRRVTQGFNGKFTHNKISSQYAVDFAMPEGTEIRAARDGVVVSIQNKYVESGVTIDFATKGNVVVIEHDDGTLALYGHLYRYGILVNEGQRVKKGNLIAYSGNTGMSTGPHLHFTVFKVEDFNTPMKSIPFQFMSTEGIVTQPIEGKWYVAK